MLSLLYQACALIIPHIFPCALYAAAALISLFGILFTLGENELSPLIIGGLIIAFLPANVLYLYAACRQMQQPAKKINYFRSMRWRREHSELLLFFCLGVFLLVILNIFFIDAGAYLYDRSFRLDVLKTKAIVADSHPTTIGGLSVLIFGSKALAALLLLAALWFWLYICRIGICIPAYTAGYFLRTSEALELTRRNVIQIAALSLLCITAVSGLAQTVLTEMPIKAQWWTCSVWSAAYFFTLQFHLALWILLYTQLTRNYLMAPLFGKKATGTTNKAKPD